MTRSPARIRVLSLTGRVLPFRASASRRLRPRHKDGSPKRQSPLGWRPGTILPTLRQQMPSPKEELYEAADTLDGSGARAERLRP